MRILICILAILSITNSVKPHPPNTSTKSPKQYIINLDLSYQERWRQLADQKKQPLLKFISYLNTIPPYKYVLPVANFILNPILRFVKTPLIDQCKALSKISGIPLQTIVLLQYFYQLGTHKTKMCTAVLVDKGDHVFHTRNLDYDFAEMLADISVNLRYIKNGKTIFRAATQAGFLGVHTGTVEGKFSINLNQRDQTNLYNSFWAFVNGNWGVTHLIRQVLQNCNNYTEAVQKLSKTKIISPAYFIVSGMEHNQGIVITRDREGVHNSYSLDEARQQGRNYIVHTNYDRQVPDPVNDYRRIPAQLKMTILGADKTTEDRVMKLVMSDFPNLNSDTLFTVTMIAKAGYMNTTIWY